MSDADALLTLAVVIAVLGVVLNLLKRLVRKRGLDKLGRSGRTRSRWSPKE